MATLNESDLDGMAKKVVERFLSRQAALAEAAADEAKTAHLNPDQIERMVQSANTEAFLRMMDQRKLAGAGDLMHEFEPIDARQVIKIVIDQNGVHVDGPHDNNVSGMAENDDLPTDTINPAEGMPGHTDSPEVEECEEECHEDLDPPGVQTAKKSPTGFSDGPFPEGKSEKKPPKKDKKEEPAKKEATLAPAQRDVVVLRMRKLAAHLAGLRFEAEVAFDDNFDRLTQHFRKLYKTASFEEFEKSALVEHGDGMGIHIAAMLRGALHLPEINLVEKRAGLIDRHVSDDTSGLRAFSDLCKIAKNAARLDASVKWIEERCAI